MVGPTLSSVFLACRDLPSSLDFYGRLGFPTKATKSRSVILDLGSSLELHLHDQLSEEEQGLFGVRAEPSSSNLVQSFMVDSLEDLKAQVPDPNLVFGPEETAWGQRLMMVKDPDGHLLEFRERSGPCLEPTIPTR